jgi:hypothetical protein
MGEWDYRTRIIPLLSSMKPATSLISGKHRGLRKARDRQYSGAVRIYRLGLSVTLFKMP